MTVNKWNKTQLGELGEVSPSIITELAGDDRVAFLSMSDIGSGFIFQQHTRSFNEVRNGFSHYAEGDILIAKITPCFENGKGCICKGIVNGVGFGSTEFIVFRPNCDVDRDFIYFHTMSETFRKLGAACMVGSAGQKRLQASFIRTYPILLPPLNEQKAISKLLTRWDRGIRQLSDLIAAKVRFKQGLMQQLLTGKRRFPGFSEKWKFKQIETFLTESRISGTDGAQAKKLTVKLYGKGVIPKSESRAGSESTKYFRRKAGQFIYSKLDFLNGAFGIIPDELDGYESTLDLPAFDFNESVDPDWFLSFVIREEFYSSHLGLANGGRKARRVNPTDLLSLSIPFPTKSEQRKIAMVMKTVSSEIHLLRKELEALKTQKKGLMQKLLTGQIRVPINTELV
jgi:type I restriction enzyme S subunit